MSVQRSASIVLGLAACVPAIRAQPEIEFNRDIRPILAENCFACHGPDPGARKADMRLDTEAGFFAERDGAPPVVVKGNPEESELYLRLITEDQDEIMPPPKSHKKLSPTQISLVKTWISRGAPWQAHWSLRAPVRPKVPTTKQAEWPRNAVDHFLLAKLEENNLPRHRMPTPMSLPDASLSTSQDSRLRPGQPPSLSAPPPRKTISN